MSDVLIVGKRNKKDLRYTAKEAYDRSEYWRRKFDETNIDPRKIDEEVLIENLFKITIEPKDLYREDVSSKIDGFKTVIFTSGTTGRPKRINFHTSEEERVMRQISWLEKYLDRDSSETMASLFPPLPSASGIMCYESFKRFVEKNGYNFTHVQIPTQLISQREILVERIRDINPTIIGALPTVIYMLANSLPESVRKNVKLIITGAEELPISLSKKILNNFPYATIIDVYGTSEDGATGYREIRKDGYTPFNFPETLVILLRDDSNYYRMYLTKIMKKPEISGLYLFNYNIGDYSEIENGNVVRIFRDRDSISLAGAKLFLSQISEIIHSYSNLIDYVVIYYPLGVSEKPKAIIRVGYVGKKPNLEGEIREKIYLANNPVRYEVEDSKMAELEISELPIEELRKDLPQRPGKPKRLYIARNDF